METNERNDCRHPGTLGVILALVTGAGIGATVMILMRKAQSAIAPTAEQLLSRCDQAAEALDSRIPQSAA